MTQIFVNENEIIIEGKNLSLKTVGRAIYRKFPGKKQFENTNHQLPKGLTRQEKLEYLYDLYIRANDRSSDQQDDLEEGDFNE